MHLIFLPHDYFRNEPSDYAYVLTRITPILIENVLKIMIQFLLNLPSGFHLDTIHFFEFIDFWAIFVVDDQVVETLGVPLSLS